MATRSSWKRRTFRSAPATRLLTTSGPSPPGKTTLLMLVAGFISPDAGRSHARQARHFRVPPHQRDIGVVFQSYALFPHMTVAQNVAYPLRARGVSKAEQQAKVKWALERVHMQDFAERRIAQLGGQQQRIALARAISFGPRALLWTSAFGARPEPARRNAARNSKPAAELGQTVIFVTHDQEEALNMSDRVAVINEGRVQQVATPRDLYLKPQNSFVANFLANPTSSTARPMATALPLATGPFRWQTPSQARRSLLCPA